ncbi:MAG: glycosyltransferase family 4 protein [Patescibacteria group bacterium]|nr:glycosyltransferase family 4 protein [Patescibacteria group bacterium]
MTTSKKTLLITLDFPPLTGGVAEYYLNRVKKMDSDEIVILAPVVIPAKAGIQELFSGSRVMARDDIKIYRRKFLLAWIYPHWLPIIKHIYYIAKKENITELWAGQVLPVGTAVWLVSKILRLPYKITCHGNDLLRAKTHPRKFKLAKRILKDARTVEANTVFTKNILIDDFKVPAEKIEIIYPENTLRREMVDEKKVGELRQKYNLSNKKVLLTVARLVESKGIDTILKIMPRLWQEISNLVYVIVGDGSQFPELLRMSSELLRIPPPNPLLIKEGSFPVILPFIRGGGPMEHRTGGVIFVGSVPHEELINYYALANAFILTPHKTGVDTESFGTVYLEAAEFGLPIIAGDVGGAREALVNYSKAIFVDSENEEEIAKEIKRVISS